MCLLHWVIPLNKYCYELTTVNVVEKCLERQYWYLATGIIVWGSLSRLEQSNPGLTTVLCSSWKKEWKKRSDKTHIKQKCLCYKISKNIVIKCTEHFYSCKSAAQTWHDKMQIMIVHLCLSAVANLILFVSITVCFMYFKVKQYENIDLTSYRSWNDGATVEYLVDPWCAFSLGKP